MDDILERLDTIIEILEEMDNAATPTLVEAILIAKNRIITVENNNARAQRKERKQIKDDLVNFNAAFDDVFEQFLKQLVKYSNDKKFKE